MSLRRKSWPLYFMDMAAAVSSRATCDRKHIGAVLVRDKCILSTGYNGAVRGAEHCDTAGHMMEAGHCVRTVHGEANALAQAARLGVSVLGADLYCTALPCWICMKLLINAGIARVFYGETYRPDRRVFLAAKQAKVKLTKMSGALSYTGTPG